AEPGNVHFSMRSILNNSGGKADALKAIYAEPALVPAMPWLGKKPAVKVHVELKTAGDRGQLVLRPEGDPVRLIVIRSRVGGKWEVAIHPADGEKPITVPVAADFEKVVISAIDRIGQETESNSIWK